MYYHENTIAFHNGNWVKAADAATSLYAQTLHYGSGVFEGIRAYETREGACIFKAREHYERLLYSAEKMHLAIPYTVDEFIEISYALLEKNNFRSAYIRPLVYAGPNMRLLPPDEVNIFICTWEWGKYLGSQLLNIMTSSYQRPNPRAYHVEAKITGHYPNSILATHEAKQKGFDEALLTDMNGNVAEGPGANFFFEKDRVLYTCPKGNILPGITRATVLEIAQILGMEVEEKFFTISEVRGSDSAFFTGTAAEVAGIAGLDGIAFALPWEETLGYQIGRYYRHLVTQPNDGTITYENGNNEVEQS